ncbi:hypothetical protein C8R34_11650 [Nitrosomonas sp. Nm84]|nr:hypothetical protein C8R34_11650 [Nitrosomonas sp. Nm84]
MVPVEGYTLLADVIQDIKFINGVKQKWRSKTASRLILHTPDLTIAPRPSHTPAPSCRKLHGFRLSKISTYPTVRICEVTSYCKQRHKFLQLTQFFIPLLQIWLNSAVYRHHFLFSEPHGKPTTGVESNEATG